jgi:hypothetical protein
MLLKTNLRKLNYFFLPKLLKYVNLFCIPFDLHYLCIFKNIV